MKKVYYIAKKDFYQYFVKPSTISWGIIFPIILTLSFVIRGKDVGLIAPGLIAMSSLFGATSMASTSVLFEKRLKEFERLVVAPLSWLEIVVGKLVGSFLFGLMTSIVVSFIILPFLGLFIRNVLLLVLAVMLSNLSFSSLGVFISLAVDDPRSAMLILNSIRLPMIFISGVFVPLSTFPVPLQILSLFMPLTYSVESIGYSLLGTFEILSPVTSYMANFIVFFVFILLSIKILEHRY